MKKRIRQVVLGILLLVLLAIAGFGVLYAGRLRTVNSIEQLTNYDDYNLYRMDIRYDYSIDDVINYGITDNQSMINANLKEALPLLRITKALLMQPSSRRCRCCPSPSKRLPSAAAPSTSRRPAATT